MNDEKELSTTSLQQVKVIRNGGQDYSGHPAQSRGSEKVRSTLGGPKPIITF